MGIASPFAVAIRGQYELRDHALASLQLVLPTRRLQAPGREMIASQASSRRPSAKAFDQLRSDRLRLSIIVGFLLLCVAGGGASRTDALSLMYLRPASVLCIAALVLTPGSWDFRTYRVPLLLLGTFAATMLIQLIPLPPDLWLALPGHGRFADAMAGSPQPWRPISLSPEGTLNSLIALLPALAVLLAFAGIRRDQQAAFVLLLIGIAAASALLGVIQVTGGPDNRAFLYAVTHNGSAVGFFANRNHQALLLAVAFPVLRVWTLLPVGGRLDRLMRNWVALGFALFLVPMLLVTGSRAGIAWGLVGLVAAYFIAPWKQPEGPRSKLVTAARLTVVFAGLLLVGAAVLLGRAVALQRMAALQDMSIELRLSAIPTMMRMIEDFFPFGSGFGSFDPVYRVYEPHAALTRTYFNHAHNELIELALTGGLAALTVLAAFLIWTVVRSIRAWFPFRARSADSLLPRLGSVMILMIFLGSIVDYPLRTPLMAAIFAIACAWLASGPRRSHSGSAEG